MKIGNGQTLLFTGDSITDCGRARPVGNAHNGLGDGYVSLVDAMLSAEYPQESIRILNTGISGNRVVDLEARWEKDVLNLEPDWLSVMIGINDVWRQFDNATDSCQVTIDLYEKTYRKILKQVHPRLKGLVLMTPYFIEPDVSDPMRRRMDEYGRIVRQLSTEYDAVFVDVQVAFDAWLKHRPTQSLCGDRVHPNRTGHMIIARAFLNEIGFTFNGKE